MNMEVALHDHRPETIRHLWSVAKQVALASRNGMQFSLNYLGVRLSATVDVQTEEVEVRRVDVDVVETATVETVSILPTLETVYDTVGFSTPLPTLLEALRASLKWHGETLPKIGKDGWIVLSCSEQEDPYTQFEMDANGQLVEVSE